MTISKFHPNRKAYNWLIYDNFDSWLERFKGHYKGHIYDLGCGELPYKQWLLKYASAYTGVDWSGTLHELKADVIADLNKPLPIEGGVADTILSLSVMEHLQEPRVFLGESHRILKRGGTMILQVPFMWGEHEAPYDYYRYTRFGLQYLFTQAGFGEVQVYPSTGFWTMWIVKFNYQTRKLIRGPWPLHLIISGLFRLVWAADQRIARWLDAHWSGHSETAGYFVVARKE
jgi:SAM-dependent methyltransferase